MHRKLYIYNIYYIYILCIFFTNAMQCFSFFHTGFMYVNYVTLNLDVRLRRLSLHDTIRLYIIQYIHTYISMHEYEFLKAKYVC